MSASQLADVIESNRTHFADLKWPDVKPKFEQEEIDFDSQVNLLFIDVVLFIAVLFVIFDM
jgi:hypothetical protein